MKQETVLKNKKPKPFVDDLLTAIVRQGARDISTRALEIEIDNFISQYIGLKDGQGRQRITRNGYLPERDIQTDVDTVPVNSCSTAVDTQSFKTLANQGVQFSTHYGVVPTKSGGISDEFYLLGRSYFQFFKYLTLNNSQFCVL